MSTTQFPRISVVVPCYNGARFLDQLLATLAAQTFRDFETIIVDDGSNEETRARLAGLDSAIRVIRQDNRGPAAARNTGIRAARAELIVPLDCDDKLDPCYLAETYAVMRRAGSDVGVVVTQLQTFGATSTIFTRRLHKFDILFSNQLSATILMRKAAWSALRGYDETMRDGYEDWDFNIRMAHAGFRAVEIAKPLFIHRVSSEGMLLSHCTSKHAVIWRSIRAKNRKLYRMPALVRTWWETRAISRVPFPVALGILALAQLPDRWFNAIMVGYRYARLFLQGWRPSERDAQVSPAR